MTKIIDNFLLKSGMPAEELCRIERTKRAFYYYGTATLGVVAVILITLGAINIIS